MLHIHSAPDTDTHAPPAVSTTYEIVTEGNQILPIVLASPHSGSIYPSEFIAQTKLSLDSLRRSEDRYMDAIMTPALQSGTPLIRALYPRIFVDLNREAFELDPGMFADPLPGYVNTSSHRAAAGLGTIARHAANGHPVYDTPLEFAAIRKRIMTYYYPYHAALRGMVDETRKRFGHCILLDCHSMPSSSVIAESGSGKMIDFVLGDCFGSSCDPRLTRTVDRFLTRAGYRVAINRPFAGGYTTRHYGYPRHRIHSLQIEINRALYMDEHDYTPLPGFDHISTLMRDLVDHLAAFSLYAVAAE